MISTLLLYRGFLLQRECLPKFDIFLLILLRILYALPLPFFVVILEIMTICKFLLTELTLVRSQTFMNRHLMSLKSPPVFEIHRTCVTFEGSNEFMNIKFVASERFFRKESFVAHITFKLPCPLLIMNDHVLYQIICIFEPSLTYCALEWFLIIVRFFVGLEAFRRVETFVTHLARKWSLPFMILLVGFDMQPSIPSGGEQFIANGTLEFFIGSVVSQPMLVETSQGKEAFRAEVTFKVELTDGDMRFLVTH